MKVFYPPPTIFNISQRPWGSKKLKRVAGRHAGKLRNMRIISNIPVGLHPEKCRYSQNVHLPKCKCKGFVFNLHILHTVCG